MRDYKSFAQKIISSGEFSGSVLLDEPMARYTTFKIGGAVPVFFEPENTDSLMVLLAALESEKISCFILGGGVSQSLDLFKDDLIAEINDKLFLPIDKTVKIEYSGLGYYASLCGAAAVAYGANKQRELNKGE